MKTNSHRWERFPEESAEAFETFIRYRDMGGSRSLDGVGRELGKSKAICERWSSRHAWVERCRAWDNHLQAERDKVAIVEARKWERRRQEALEINWQAAQRLRSKLDSMLAFPIQRQEVSKDGRTITFEPARWTLATAATLARTAAEIEAAVLIAVGHDLDDIPEAEQ